MLALENTKPVIDRELFRQEEKRLAQQLSTKVRIQQKQSGKGTVMIHFDSPQALEQIIEKIG